MGDTQQGLSIPAEDPVRQYTRDEEQALTLNLKSLLGAIYRSEYAERRIDRYLLCEFHERLFRGVRDHAGRHRDRGYGQERLTFGPHRSEKRELVRAELDKLLQKVQRQAQELLEYRRSPITEDYIEQSIKLAVQAHAAVIRIHPFEDGNGRTSRALLDHLLLRLGLKPIPIEVPKQEYIECLNHYFASGDIELLLDLYIRLYPLGDPSPG